MKVLLFNGSPKRGESDTLRLSKAFLDGAGYEYEQIVLMEKTIKPCLGCFCCWYETPGKCVQDDDAAEILEKLIDADLVIWSMPLYCFGMPSHVKALIDRLLPRNNPAQITDSAGHTYHTKRWKSNTRHILISGSGFPDIEGNFDALILQFQRLFGKDSPMILCPESPLLNNEDTQYLAEPYLEIVRRAGQEFAENGFISKETVKAIETPMMDPDTYRNNRSEED